MRELRNLIHDIHKGKNLTANLKRYEDMAVRTYNDYAALELTFSAYTMLQEAVEEKPELAVKEKRIIDSILQSLDRLGSGNCPYEEMISEMVVLRGEITDKMTLFTAYTDRLICYEYVLNRMELKYMPEKELDRQLADVDEEQFLNQLMGYLFGTKDKSVINDKLHMLTGQLPIHMTKEKLFEKIREAATLYQDGDKSALDNFFYLIRTFAMVYEPKKYVGEYPDFEEVLERLTRADYTAMQEAEYGEMTELLEQGVQAIHEITDFYYSTQKVVNGIYALCLTLPYQKEESRLVRDGKEIWRHLAKKEYRDEMLVPLEGRIEAYVEQSSYMESVLFEIKTSYKKELAEGGQEKFFEDFSLVSNLLSDSLFIDLDKALLEETADSGYVQERTGELLKELSDKFGEVSRPVKRAIMGRILEILPILFQTTEDVEKYIRVNLLGCSDKAEKYIVMLILRDLIREEQEW